MFMLEIFLLTLISGFNFSLSPMINLIFLLSISLIGAQILMSLNNSWMGLIMILIYSGGLLVIFLFIVSLFPNFKLFKFSVLNLIPLFLGFI